MPILLSFRMSKLNVSNMLRDKDTLRVHLLSYVSHDYALFYQAVVLLSVAVFSCIFMNEHFFQALYTQKSKIYIYYRSSANTPVTRVTFTLLPFSRILDEFGISYMLILQFNQLIPFSSFHIIPSLQQFSSFQGTL